MKKLLFLITALMVAAVYLKGFSPLTPVISYTVTPELGEAVVVSFPLPISESEAKESFSIRPQVSGELVWFGEHRELRFVPLEGFDPDVSYEVHAGRKGWFFAQIAGESRRRTFQPRGLPVKFNARARGHAPDSAWRGEDAIYYITESGLKRRRTMDAFLSYAGNREEDIRVIDKATLARYPDNTLIHIENDPDVYKLEGEEIRLIQNPEAFEVFGLDWDAIAPVNLTEFNSYRRGEPLAVPTPATPHKKAAEGKLIDVDLDKMRLTLWNGGKIAAEFPVAGKGNPSIGPTRKGLFSVRTKERNHFSSLSRVWMPWSMQYSGDYFIHEWPYWPGGAPITSKYSAGCVRLNKGDAKKVYDFADIGTPMLVR